MKGIGVGLCACLLCAALAGCGEGLLSVMGRVNADPSPIAPRVASFDTEYAIAVSWDADAAAEEYVLERATDAASPSWSAVYRGGGTSFTDTGRVDQTRYLYRLSMTRGSRVFGPTESVVGVGSAACKDSLEPNDTEEEATALEYDRTANLYFYRSYGGQTVSDTDWYSVSIPPRRVANIVVTQAGLTGGSVSTFVYFYLKGSAPVSVTNNVAIPVTNTSFETRTFLMRITPNPDQFIVDPTLAGGSFIDYTVSLLSIT
ncbi:MAG TPA: hypothetical protein VHE79_13930, partial [Spirochaetia bacterium]